MKRLALSSVLGVQGRIRIWRKRWPRWPWRASCFLGRALVAHDALAGDAVAREPGQSTLEKRDRAVLALIRQEFGVGEPTRVIDGDMQMLPAGAPVPALAGATPVLRWPILSMRASFLVSMWISSPVRSRS